MLTVRLSPKLEARLDNLAKETGLPKACYAKRALTEFLDEHEDCLIAVARLEDDLPPISLEKVIRRLGLKR